MASGIINLGTTNAFSARISWSSTPNVANNTSTVIAKLQFKDSRYTQASYYWGMESYFSGGSLIKDVYKDKQLLSVPSNDWLTVETFTHILYHKTDGTCRVGFWAIAERKVEGGAIGTSGVVYVSLDTISRTATISSAPNFTDEENPTITYSNPTGNNATLLQACISFDGSKDDIAYRDISKTGTSYTFNLTDAERTILRNGTLSGSNKRKVKFFVKSTVNGTTKTSALEKELTIVNASPSVSSTYYDVNEDTVALTQNSDIFIKGYSNLQYQVEATAKKGASITGYNTLTGSKSSTLQRSTFYNIDTDTITFTATDNRNLTGKVELPIELVDYFPVTCSFTAEEIELDTSGDASTATARVEMAGEFFNSTFGADGVANELKIEILHTGLEDWVEIPDILWGDNVDGNNYSASFTVSGLDYTKSITFQCRVSDKLSETTTDEKTLKLLPIFDWSENEFNFNTPVQMNGETVLRHNATANNLVVSASGGYIYFRVKGTNSTSGEVRISPQGNIELSGDIIINGKSVKSLLGI